MGDITVCIMHSALFHVYIYVNYSLVAYLFKPYPSDPYVYAIIEGVPYRCEAIYKFKKKYFANEGIEI